MPIRNNIKRYNDNYPQGNLYDEDINRSTKRKRALSNENVNELNIAVYILFFNHCRIISLCV